MSLTRFEEIARKFKRIPEKHVVVSLNKENLRESVKQQKLMSYPFFKILIIVYN